MSEEQRLSVRDAYLEQMVESASPESLLMMLVDGAVNFIRRAGFALEKEKFDDVHVNLVKAQDIYLELVITLDLDAGEFAENLALVYQYLYNLLIEANLEKSAEKIQIALKLAVEIRDLWTEAIEKAQQESGVLEERTIEPVEPVSVKLPKSTGVYEPVGKSVMVSQSAPLDESESGLNIMG
ncbi:MAG TPA: flagellar export chaperone FliS [Firmicutes bacterium]|nr:flagellar export chaperone FliS [Bacillota bacterium]